MSTAEQWAGLLGQEAGEAFSLKFERLGLEARCRPLRAGEVEECVRMGGERGLRYALYLACDELREAGEHLKKQGALASAFEITERLSYGDVVAAGAAILGQSGTDTGASAWRAAGRQPSNSKERRRPERCCHAAPTGCIPEGRRTGLAPPGRKKNPCGNGLFGSGTRKTWPTGCGRPGATGERAEGQNGPCPPPDITRKE